MKFVPEEVIQAFVSLLEIERYLFSNQDLAELADLIPDLPANTQQISEEIVAWCQARPRVLDVLKDDLETRGLGDSTPPPNPEFFKKLLINAVRQDNSSPSSPPKPPDPKPDS